MRRHLPQGGRGQPAAVSTEIAPPGRWHRDTTQPDGQSTAQTAARDQREQPENRSHQPFDLRLQVGGGSLGTHPPHLLKPPAVTEHVTPAERVRVATELTRDDTVAKEVTTSLLRRSAVARTAMRDDTTRMLVNRAQFDNSNETRERIRERPPAVHAPTSPPPTPPA
ncbi:DUF6192 family protein [Streptomyces europaeiscabiei]|uniref:DUF6192 family protein n=1 Tax=Streptomyces europaeiscabiei TaxID=146819 RepID=UPI002E2A3907|nr:DUF6192 family protein [Streptomyces europaeiscabiei]